MDNSRGTFAVQKRLVSDTPVKQRTPMLPMKRAIQDSLLAPILALPALLKVSRKTDFGFGLGSQNFRELVQVCVKTQDWETDVRSLEGEKRISEPDEIPLKPP